MFLPEDPQSFGNGQEDSAESRHRSALLRNVRTTPEQLQATNPVIWLSVVVRSVLCVGMERWLQVVRLLEGAKWRPPARAERRSGRQHGAIWRTRLSLRLKRKGFSMR